MEYKYNDGLCPGGRRPRLYLARGGEAKKFAGQNVPGYCAVTTAQYHQNGKWSSTDYVLDLAPGVRPLKFLSPLHGTWGDGLSSWGEVAEALGLPVGAAQELVRAEYPKTGERLDRAEEFALAAEEGGGSSETVIVSFGAPGQSAVAAGYWSEPKKGRTSSGAEVVVRPGPGEHGPDWSRPEVVAPQGGRVISSRHTPGMRGGYWAVEVLVPMRGAGA